MFLLQQMMMHEGAGAMPHFLHEARGPAIDSNHVLKAG